jgi:hypothetical protein
MTNLQVVKVAIVNIMATASPRVVWIAALGSGLILVVSAVAAPIGLLVLLVVGPWDLIVWLTGVDWLTTRGHAPAIGAIGAVAGTILAIGATLIFQASTERLEQIADGAKALEDNSLDRRAPAPLDGARQRP